MDRRKFLTWLGLGFLASGSLSIFLAIAKQNANKSQTVLSPPYNQDLPPISFYVSPQGKDIWSGKLAKPNRQKTDGSFATIHQARDAIRAIKKNQGGVLKQSITVFLRTGTYYLKEPLTLTPEDSGNSEFAITYRAYPGEKPIISGGEQINDWQQQGDLWVANLPAVKNKEWYFRQLRVDKSWATLARYPKITKDQPLADQWLYLQSQKIFQASKQGKFDVSIRQIHHPEDSLSWQLNIPRKGKYKIWLRYAHNMQAYGTANMGDRTALRFDQQQDLPISDLPDTGSFDIFRWQEVAEVELSPDNKQLNWRNLEGGGINIDAFCLSDDLDWHPDSAILVAENGIDAKIQQPKQNKNLLIIHAETFSEAIAQEAIVFPEAKNRTQLKVTPETFPQWQNWQGAEVHIFPLLGWVNAILPVKNIDAASQTIFVKSKHNFLAGNRFFIANSQEVLNEPGEWSLSQETGKLSYYPLTSDFPDRAKVIAPKLNQLISLKGDHQAAKYVQNITFQDLTFQDTSFNLIDNYYNPNDAAIWLSHTKDCRIDNCRFTHLGGYGICLEQNSHQNQITFNTMTKLGQGGVLLSGKTVNQPFNNLIAANRIDDCGKVYKHVAGIYVDSGSENRLIHNRITRMPRYGISLKSLGKDSYSHRNIVEFNEIIDTNLETCDSGAIETLGLDKKASGNIIRHNFIRNVVGVGTNKSGQIVSPYFTWGIYLDDYSSGTLVYGNIVVGNVLGGVCIHGGQENRIENNILVDGSQMQIRLQPRDEFMKNNLFQQNIVIYQNPDAQLWFSYPEAWKRNREIIQSDHNLYWQNGDLNLETTGKAITPEGSFQQWQAAGFDLNSLISKPPFPTIKQNIDQIKPENFKLAKNSEIFTKIGFKAIPVEKIGIDGFKA